MSNCLRPYGLQHTLPPCLSPNPRVYTNLCPLSWGCHPTISSSVIPFSFHLQSFPASGSFQMSQFFQSGGQSIGVWASASVLPVNVQDWFPLGLMGLIFLLSEGFSRVFSSTTVQKHQFFGTQPSMVQVSHPYMTTGKTIALTKQNFIHSSSVSFSSCQKSPKNVPKYLLKKFPWKWINSRVDLMDFSSVAQSCPTLGHHGLQHARPPCPSPTPGVYSN